MRQVAATFLILTLCPGAPHAQILSEDASFEAAFVCPENQPDDTARDAAVKEFLSWVVSHHPTWTVNDAIAFRVHLLESHHCEVTLQHMRDNAASHQ